MSESELAVLAEYHVGLFAGAASKAANGDAATVAHGLWLLMQVAERRRKEWLDAARDAR